MEKIEDRINLYIGSRIKEQRIACNMTQEALGNILKTKYQQIQKYEKGTTRISAARLKVVSEALNVPVTYFYGE